MIEVKDEILNGEPKYRLRDNNGNVIYDNVSVEMTTPVIEEGTPINKALFDNLKGHIEATSNYAEPSLSQFISGYEMVAGDIIPKTWETVSELHEYRSGDVTLKTNNSTQNNFYPWKACDGVDGGSSYWYTVGVTSGIALTIDFNNPQKISKMKLSYKVVDGLNYLYIQGSNDNETWTTLYRTTTENVSTLTERTLNNVDYYRYYRLFLDISKAGYSVYIYEWQVSEYEAPVFDNLLTLNNAIKEYSNNQRVLIKIPEEMDTTQITHLNINNLGNKLIIGELLANKRYELIYNGTNFDIINMDELIEGSSIVFDITLTENVSQIEIGPDVIKDNATYLICPKELILSGSSDYLIIKDLTNNISVNTYVYGNRSDRYPAALLTVMDKTMIVHGFVNGTNNFNDNEFDLNNLCFIASSIASNSRIQIRRLS